MLNLEYLKTKEMKNLFKTRWSKVANLFMGHYLDARMLFTKLFNALPNMYFIGDINTGEAFTYINKHYRFNIKNVYQHNYYEYEKAWGLFNTTIIILDTDIIIELRNDYVMAYYGKGKYIWCEAFINEIKIFNTKENKAKTPIGIMRHNAHAEN